MRIEWYNSQNGRSYLVDFFEDLLGDWILIRRWRGIKRRGNQKIEFMPNFEAGVAHIDQIHATRVRHGYKRTIDPATI